MKPVSKRMLHSFDELSEEIVKLLEFSSRSEEILRDILTACNLKDGNLLKRVVMAYGDLKPISGFTVAPSLFGPLPPPRLVIIN